MDISFNNVLPHPLREYPHNENSVWKSSFTIPKQKRVLLNASSGKGKTTFVNILFGLRKDYDGEVLFDGENVNTFSLDKWISLRKDKLSAIFQDLQLFPHLSVMENLHIKNSLTKHKSEDEIRKMLSHLGIRDKENKPCGILSMGQQQRVAIIRGLLQPFDWLLMDEPFSHLDTTNSKLAMELINKECNEQNSGFILTSLGSSHDEEYNMELMI